MVGKRASNLVDKQRSFMRIGIGIVIVLLTVYIFVPQLSSLQQSVQTLRAAYMPLLGLAVLSWCTTFVAATLTYMALSKRKLRFGRTLLVEIASGLTNRLVPAGAGAVAVNVRYLIKSGYGSVEAAGITALNNGIGVGANIILLVACSWWDDADALMRVAQAVHPSSNTMLLLGGGVTAVATMFVWLRGKSAYHASVAIMQRLYRVVPGVPRLVAALASSTLLTAGYMGCLICVGLAMNVHISVFSALVVLSFGVAAASATPTPGGLGGAEAVLAAALLAVGVSPHQGVMVALTYRFITYWLPILPGLAAMRAARVSRVL